MPILSKMRCANLLNFKSTSFILLAYKLDVEGAEGSLCLKLLNQRLNRLPK